MGWLRNLNKKLVRKRIATLTELIPKQESLLEEAKNARNGVTKLHYIYPFDKSIIKTGGKMDKIIRRLEKEIPKNKETLNKLLRREDNGQTVKE